MKPWSDDNPKAALLARKRNDILSAARTQFLETGYAGTSMESIAKAANVSIMTLYRHAETKDALFSAVVIAACHPENPEETAELEEILTLPFPELLVRSALHMQDILTNAGTIALMRLVIGEVGRFPHLAELAYQGFVERLEDIMAHVLFELPETCGLGERDRHALGRRFVDRLVGAPVLRSLLGLPVPDQAEKRRRAELARDDLMEALRGSIAGMVGH